MFQGTYFAAGEQELNNVGISVETCTCCGYGYTEKHADALGHDYADGDCIHCGEHLDYIYECENGSTAPCSVDGECVYGCGKQFPATGVHELDNPCEGGMCWMCWTEIEPAHEYFYPCDPVCMNCYEITNPDAAHPIVAVEAVAATCTATGNVAYWYCSDCGYCWTDEALTQQTNQRNVIVPATGEHTYENGTCTGCGEADPSVPTGPIVDTALNHTQIALGLGGSIEAQVYLKKKTIQSGYTDVYVKFVMDVYDSNGVATKTEYILRDFTETKSSMVYIFGMAPCYMGRTVEIQTFATKDGVEYCSELAVYSIKQGIMERLEEAYLTKDSDTQMSNLCTLLVDMLYYGAEAQKSFGQAQYDGLVTEGLDEKYVALKTQTIPEATLTNTAVQKNTVHELHAYNLGLGEAVDMQFTFKLASADYSGYTVKVTWGDGNERVFTADEFYVKSSKYNRVAVVFNNLGAPEMDVEVSVALYKDGVQVSSTYTSSIEANAKSHLDAGTNVDLVNAMLNYGNSAKRLFGL